MNKEQAQKFIEVENKLREADLVFIRCNYKYSPFYDDSTAYTCYVNGVEESWGAEDELQALLYLKEDNETDMQDLKDLNVSFNPSQAHDDGDSFEIPLIDIVNGIYEIDIIK